MANLNKLAAQLNIVPETEKPTSIVKQNKRIGKRRTWLEEEATESICLIDPIDISNWEFHDRPETELGDIKSLANEFITVGQQQPCVVRPTPVGSNTKYELIIGERRWRASALANLKLKVIIKDLDDNDAALSQAAENDNRKDLSDYAKGLSYARLIENGIITRKDLIEKLGRNRQYVSALLSFSEIPKSIVDAIGDMSKVSYRTGETIKRLAAKSEAHVEAIIAKARQISTGSLGNKKLPELVEKFIGNDVVAPTINSQKLHTSDGRHIFTWRKDNNSMRSIHFPKDISKLIASESLDTKNISKRFMEVINDELSKLK